MAVLALVGAAAWACTPQASIKTSVASGTPGTNITVTGSTFDATGQPVKVWWGGAGKQLVATANVTASRGFTATFAVPNVAGGVHIVAATQIDASGQPIAGSPVNTTFRVDAPTAATPVTDLQGTPDNSVVEPAAAPVAVAEPTPAPAAEPTPAPATRPAPRVRVAPAQPSATATPAPAPAPAAAAPAPATEAAPAPAVTPAAPEVAPAAPARRSVMVSMADDSDGSPALAIALVGVGLVLALGATALVLAGRRDSKAPAKARR